MTAHVHADKMAQYAEDAKTTDKPWELWERKVNGMDWFPCVDVVEWRTTMEYRRKPRTININGYEVPEPLREAPPIGSLVHVPLITGGSAPAMFTWNGFVPDEKILAAGVCHLTREAAELHSTALLSFTKVLS